MYLRYLKTSLFQSMPTNEETRTVKKSSMKNRYKGVLPSKYD